MKSQSNAVVLACAVVVILSVSAALAAPDFRLRPGTIGHALLQPDGAAVHLDAETVAKIRFRESPQYFTVAEFFDRNTRLVVLAPPPPEIRQVRPWT